jgi:hypothetical protein
MRFSLEVDTRHAPSATCLGISPSRWPGLWGGNAGTGFNRSGRLRQSPTSGMSPQFFSAFRWIPLGLALVTVYPESVNVRVRHVLAETVTRIVVATLLLLVASARSAVLELEGNL